MEYRSGYKDLNPHIMCEFAYDLHQYVVSQGGGYENYKVVRAEPTHGGMPDFRRAYVPYKKQAEFASDWWQHHNSEFRNLAWLWKDWWINDSILDGKLLYNRYQFLRVPATEKTTQGSYGDAILAILIKQRDDPSYYVTPDRAEK